MRVLLIGLVATTISLLLASANAAEPAGAIVAHHHRWHVARIGPQSCFLIVPALLALIMLEILVQLLRFFP